MADLIVNGYGAMAELPDLSPFVSKLEAYLRLAGVDYDKRGGDMRVAPRGKMPYINHGDRVVGDSARIIEHLRDQGVADLDAWLSPGQRAELHALSSIFELELYFILCTFRWREDAGWATYAPHISGAMANVGVPGFAAGLVTKVVRRSMIKQLHAQGAGRRPAEENLARVRELFDALDHLVGLHPGPWWFGDQPSSADAIAHAFVSGLITRAVATPLHDLLDGRAELRAWYEHADAAVRGA